MISTLPTEVRADVLDVAVEALREIKLPGLKPFRLIAP